MQIALKKVIFKKIKKNKKRSTEMLCHGKIANKSLVDKEGAVGIVVGTLYISYSAYDNLIYTISYRV